MPREIKFRTWDEKAKTMFQVATLHIYMLPKRKRPLMLYTGLHDKNGKEIYEEDILRCKSKDADFSVS